MQLGHLKLSGYGLLSTQGVQNRSQNCWIVSQSEVTLQYVRDPGAPAASRTKGVVFFCRQRSEFKLSTLLYRLLEPSPKLVLPSRVLVLIEALPGAASSGGR